VGGGNTNAAGGNWSTVSGGSLNSASSDASTVSGGNNNIASGKSSTVPGGQLNTAGGDYSFATGRRAKIDALHDDSFLFADQSNFDFNSASSNEFAVRSTSGVRFVVAIDGSGNPTNTCSLTPTSTAWSCTSDRNIKENFTHVNARQILSKLSLIPIMEWNLKGQNPAIRHLGPTAQDFYTAFGLGEDNRHINLMDENGIALISIQALYEMSLEKDKKIEELQQRIENLEKQVAELMKK
jgi:hypothetical protein